MKSTWRVRGEDTRWYRHQITVTKEIQAENKARHCALLNTLTIFLRFAHLLV